MRYRLGAEELIELGRGAHAQRSDRQPFFSRRLGQDVSVEARLNLGESFGSALTAVSKVVQVTPEVMSVSPETARQTFLALVRNSPPMQNYVLRLLVLAAVVVKEGVRALQLSQAQVSNILVGASEAMMEIIPEAELPEKLRAAEEEIIQKAPENLKGRVRQIVEGAGVTAGNLAPNLPEGEQRVSADGKAPADLTTGQKALLVGLPVAALIAVGWMAK